VVERGVSKMKKEVLFCDKCGEEIGDEENYWRGTIEHPYNGDTLIDLCKDCAKEGIRDLFPDCSDEAEKLTIVLNRRD
jgi:hypothetical protein